jgi:hypothetical protein
MAGMAGMAEWQKEWQNGRMAEVATYVLFMVHANDNDNDTLIFYITETNFEIGKYAVGSPYKCGQSCTTWPS